MSDPAGQITTRIPADGEGGAGLTVISAGREIEQGSRSMLILAEGLFRLDVVPEDDMVHTLVRNLSPHSRIELRLDDIGGTTTTPEGSEKAEAISTGRFGGEVVLTEDDGEEWDVARLVVGSVCHVERGLTSFTAQATLPERV
jgi:hypothetical protein